MKQKLLKTLSMLGLMVFAMPVYAGHGSMDSTSRDAWINEKLAALVDAGLLKKPSQAFADFTNLQAAQLTRDAAQIVVAQMELPPPMLGSDPGLPLPTSDMAAPMAISPQATKSLQELVEEFRGELSTMDLDLVKLEDSLDDRSRRFANLSKLQEKYLKRTGMEGGGYSRGLYNVKDNPGKKPSFTDVMFMEMRFRAIPVPYNLFDLRLRVWRTVGLYYADPINPTFDFRWISLTNFNDVSTITAGDFYKSYTPLTLWNYDVPVYTLVEPTSLQRNRKEVEEILFLDHGNDWRMRGFQVATKAEDSTDKFFSRLDGQVMGGSLKAPSAFRFGDYFAGTRWSLGLLENNLELSGTGLLIWNDPGSASVPYLLDFPSTFAKEYRILSGGGRFKIPFDQDVNISAEGEYAGSRYLDDNKDPSRVFEDWAFRANASFAVSGLSLKAKLLNVGPYFYSPGAQTNRYSAQVQPSYVGENDNRDALLQGYRDRFTFQGVDRPTFAVFDRLSENMLPYGDATPNRLGWIFSLSGKFGKDGWLKPQASWVPDIAGLGVQEIQANYILNSAGTGALAAENGAIAPNAPTRQYSGIEGALSMDLAKALDSKGTLRLDLDYKSQKTDFPKMRDVLSPFYNPLYTPLETKNYIAALDFSIPVKGALEGLVWSLAYARTESAGNEYALGGGASTYGAYPFYLENGPSVFYTYSALNLTRQAFIFGAQYSLTSTIRVKGDIFYNQNVAPVNFEYAVWRISYEASF